MASFRIWVVEALAGVLATAGGVAALSAVLGLAGRLAPRLDVFSHFAPIYAAIAVAAGVVAALVATPWRRAILALAAVGLLASAAMIAPEYLRPQAPQAGRDAPGQLKVVQFNARRSNADIGRVADWLIAQDPDLITVTEARYDLRDLMHRRGWEVAGGQGHLMIFTRERFLSMNRPERGSDWNVTFVNAAYASDSGPYEGVTAHLRWPTSPIIAMQIRETPQFIAAMPRQRMVLAGDFNATPWSAELRTLDRRLGLIRRDRGVATWPAQIGGREWPLPFLPIDHVYAGPGWATVSVERGPWLGSDHYPLIVTLAPVAPR